MSYSFSSFSKRLFAFLLGAIMLVSSCVIINPTIKADAASNCLESRFFEDGLYDSIKGTKLIVNKHGAVFDSDQKAVHFTLSYDKYNYLYIPFREVLPQCNMTDGFTVSFMAKENSRDDWARFFEISTIDAYGNGDATYLYAACKGLTRVKNTNKDGNESGAADITRCDGTWHRYTIVLKGNTLKAYSDGKLTGSVTDRDRIREDFYTTLANRGLLLFGASSYSSDPGYSGYLKDFRIYNRALTENEAFDENSIVEEDDGYYGLLYDLEHPFKANAFARYKDDNNNISLDDYEKTYNSVLYASNVNDNTREYSTVWVPEMAIWKGNEKCDPRLFHPVTVLYYDGKNTPYFPVTSYFRHWCSSAHTYNIYYYALFLAENANGLYFKENWRGSDDERMNVQWNLLNKDPGPISYTDTTNTSQHWSKYAAVGSMSFSLCYANYLYFNGNTLRVDEYYRKITPTWGLNFGNNGNDIKRLREVGTKPIYVINAKPYYDRITSAKTNLAKMRTNMNKYGEDYYDSDDIAKYVRTIKKLLDFRPTTYDFANNTESSVIAVANQIKSLAQEYDASVPTHTHNYLPVHTAAKDDVNGYTERICVDGDKLANSKVYDDNDWSVYDAELEVVQSNINSTQAYTADSISNYKKNTQAIISKIKAYDTSKSQAYINNLITQIDACKSALELRKYTVKFDYQIDDAPAQTMEKVFFYGDKATFTGIENTSTYKWTYEDADGVKLYARDSDSIDFVVGSDTKFMVYATTDNVAQSNDTVKINLLDNNGKVSNISYAKVGDRIRFTDMTYTVGTNTNLANLVPFYYVRGFKVNDSTSTYGNNSSYIIPTGTKEINLKPVYNVY